VVVAVIIGTAGVLAVAVAVSSVGVAAVVIPVGVAVVASLLHEPSNPPIAIAAINADFALQVMSSTST
jgi:hypothetical protein